jgi:DNA replication protein DnaC
MDSKLHYSSALSNIPQKKVEERIAAAINACEVCSKLDKKDGMNGICGKCNLKIKEIDRYRLANIPVSYWGISMEKDFVGYKPLKDKYDEMVSDLPKMFSDGKSLLISGQHGTGKTLMATALLRRAVLKGYSGFYTTLSDAVAALTGAEYQEQLGVRKQLQMIDVLVIDEFDQRFVSSSASSDLFARSLENIIRTRLANGLPTMVISNSPNIVETLSGQLKESLGSLFALLDRVVVLGEDNRKVK